MEYGIMKRKISIALAAVMLFSYTGVNSALAIQAPQQKTLQAAPNARTIELAFVFDGPSDKNKSLLETFQKTITRSLLPDYKAAFPADLIFNGDWTEKGVAAASERALASKATMVISMGYMSSNYYSTRKSPNKFVVTIDQYGLRDLGGDFFNPIQQYVKDFVLFKKLVPTQHKTAILMNEGFYKTQSDWNGSINKKLKEKGCDNDFVVIPVNNNVKSSLAKMPSDVDSVFVTPLFNLSTDERKELYNILNSKKLPSFSGLGREDVSLGALIGTSTRDLDKKLAEATSFNIHGVLHGNKVKSEKVAFYDAEERVVKAIIRFIQRHIDKLKEMIALEEIAAVRDNLVEMKQVCENICYDAPQTFHEVCQWTAFFNCASRIYTRDGAGFQIDRLLLPYYERDVKNGILNKLKL